MPKSKEDQIVCLKLHRENLAVCLTFEDYKRCHCAWIDMLVTEAEADLATHNAIVKFMGDTEFVTKLGEATDTIVKAAAGTWVAAGDSAVGNGGDAYTATIEQTGFDPNGNCIRVIPERGHCDACESKLTKLPCQLLVPERGHCALCDSYFVARDQVDE